MYCLAKVGGNSKFREEKVIRNFVDETYIFWEKFENVLPYSEKRRQSEIGENALLAYGGMNASEEALCKFP